MFAPIFACLIGCGQQMRVAVEAAAAPDAKAETRFVMVASDPHVTPTNPDYLAIAKAVARALASQGFEAANPSDAADLVVVIDWMVSDPREVDHHIGGDIGEPLVRGAAPGGKNGMPLGGTNNAASFGFGLEPAYRADLVYTRTLTLKGVDRAAYRADPAAKPLWTMTLTSDGDTDNVAAFAPFMVAAGMPYLATNAGRTRSLVSATEAPVKYVKGEIPSLPSTAP